MSKKISLTQGKFAIVDDEDFEWLNQYKWYAAKIKNTYYAIRMVNRRTLWMHREILKPSKDLQTDHKNSNGLDNRRENLRACTCAENLRNQRKKANCTNKFKGITPVKEKWRAQIYCNKKHIILGCFATPAKAAHAYDTAAIKYFGEFAQLNFPVECIKR